MSFFSVTSKPFLIAGPCSAESREQVLATAGALAGLPVRLFRAGVWKPRSRPGHFEGNGTDALQWLREVKATYGLPVATEVAEPAHVAAALKHGIDVLWLGARTTVNPFDVQRLADALKGVPVPVLVKNPVSPDVDLWQGALERLEKAGVAEVGAVHRGFSSYKSGGSLRNPPNWPVPIELRRRRPDLPIICDPSHIAGIREEVASITQKAMDMGFEGLMIETHPNPAAALSDAQQQLTPAALKDLLEGLVIRQTRPETHSAELEYLRQIMDSLDAEIIDLIARRTELSTQMGSVKKALEMTAYQPDRWREIVATRGEHARLKNLDPEFIVSLFQRIHDESIRLQLSILEGGPSQARSLGEGAAVVPEK